MASNPMATGTLLEQATSLAAMSSSKPQDIIDTKINNSCLTPPNTPMVNSAPWGSLSAEKKITPSFEDLMSEQLAAQLQLDEDKAYVKNIKNELTLKTLETMKEKSASSNATESLPDTSDDVILAHMLQAEMDKEYNEYITKKENQVNKDSKVRLTFNNYRTDEMFASSEDDDEDYEEEVEGRTGEDVDPSSNMLNVSNDKGYVMFGKEVVTKHDHEICGRKNTAKLEDGLPPEFNTGDARGMDLQLSNRIFNSLRKHAMSEQRRGQRLHENKERYTAEHAVDERTRLILHRFVDRGIIASVNGVVSIGKEAVVIHADGGDIAASEFDSQPQNNSSVMRCVEIPKECAIKVFKTTLNEFRTRDKYIKDDFRFKDRFKKLNPRKIIHMWAEKEMHNLVRMTEAGIRCPEVVLLRKHVLVMSFIGGNQQPAPKLKDAILSTSQKKSAFSQVLEMMKSLYDNCKLIHADLSEFNLLWHDSKVWMIDVSQSVEPSHPHGLEFLLRDCTNISRFFTNSGLPDVPSPYQLFNEVSGLNLPLNDDADFLSHIEVLQNSSEEHSRQGKLKSSQILEQSAN